MTAQLVHVVIPFYNEEEWIWSTLDALARQSDLGFAVICVDNASSDQGAAVVRNFQRGHPELDISLVAEPEKGTGAASDTGFRHAIARGATLLARTDADCLPHPDWIRNIRRGFAAGRAELLIGRILPRDDDYPLTVRDRLIMPLVLTLAENFGKLHRNGPEFKSGYIMCAGNNLAITADLYLRAGGFPRTSIEELHEDRELLDRVRRLTDRFGKQRDMVVYNSTRRLRRYGYLNTLLWYWDHKFQPDLVDVR